MKKIHELERVWFCKVLVCLFSDFIPTSWKCVSSKYVQFLIISHSIRDVQFTFNALSNSFSLFTWQGTSMMCEKEVYITERDAYKHDNYKHFNFFSLNLISKLLTYCLPLLMVFNDFFWGTLLWPTGGGVLVVQFLTFIPLESISDICSHNVEWFKKNYTWLWIYSLWISVPIKACTCTDEVFFSNYKSKFPTTVEMQTSNRYMSDQFTSAPNLRTRTLTLVFLL